MGYIGDCKVYIYIYTCLGFYKDHIPQATTEQTVELSGIVTVALMGGGERMCLILGDHYGLLDPTIPYWDPNPKPLTPKP